MSIYYVSDYVNEDGEHEVHEEECSNLPENMSRTYLGNYVNEIEALEVAIKNYYHNSNGCPICCIDAHR